jgi:hypothetical protein
VAQDVNAVSAASGRFGFEPIRFNSAEKAILVQLLQASLALISRWAGSARANSHAVRQKIIDSAPEATMDRLLLLLEKVGDAMLRNMGFF